MRSVYQVKAPVTSLMNPWCLPEKPALFSSNRKPSQAGCLMKTWWSRPGKKGLRTPGRGHSSTGPSAWAIRV